MLKSAHLIDVIYKEGGIAIPAHPFRDSGYGARLDDLVAKHGSALSAVEAINGQNSPAENERAIAAAEKLGLTAVGGSDAHFPTAALVPDLRDRTGARRSRTSRNYASSSAPAARARTISRARQPKLLRVCHWPAFAIDSSSERAKRRKSEARPAITSRSPFLSRTIR